MAKARQLIDGPAFVPMASGLWDAAQKPAANGVHWQNGVEWQERCGNGGQTYDPCLAVTGTGGSPARQAALAQNVFTGVRGATAFTVYAEFDCGPVGLTDAESAAQDALARVEMYQVENAFWNGGTGVARVGGAAVETVYPHLAADTELMDGETLLQSAADQVLAAPGDDAAVALGALEGALSDCYHGQGVIHVSPMALPTLSARGLLHRDDTTGQLLTKAGNLVVVGQGYDGSAPDGTAAEPAQSWIYATGQVFGYRGPVVVPTTVQSFDRANNTYHLMAQRTYLFGWECCHLAALVDLGVPTGSEGVE
jgi:hypothetical protein